MSRSVKHGLLLWLFLFVGVPVALWLAGQVEVVHCDDDPATVGMIQSCVEGR